MAFSRSHLYQLQDQKISFFFRTLSHPARLKIIRKLSADGPCTVGSIHEFHPISLSSLSDHLEILRDAHIVDFKEKYPFTYYSLNQKNYKKLKYFLKLFLDEM